MTGDGGSVYRRSLSPKAILLAKSETSTIQARHALVNSVCPWVSPHGNYFASRIKSDDDPQNYDAVWALCPHT
jgi:hypothetical protein